MSGRSTESDGSGPSVRVDSWLWSVRVYRTRSEATAACRGGHVRINGAPAKAASKLNVDDVVHARAHDATRELRVRRLVAKRVGAAVAAECVEDLTPPPPPRDPAQRQPAERARGSGRPTKRDRRRIDRLRDR